MHSQSNLPRVWLIRAVFGFLLFGMRIADFRYGFCHYAFVVILLMTMAGTTLAAGKTVLLIAGEPSHGRMEHEFPDGVELLARCINESGLGLRAFTSVGWPQDSSLLRKADTVVLYSDGGDDHVAKGQEEVLRLRLQRGKNLVVLHYSLEPSSPEMASLWRDAIGGAFEVDWSVNPIWTLHQSDLRDHPIRRGVRIENIVDEWYFHLRFRSDISPILLAHPPIDVLGRDGPRSGNPAVRAALEAGEPQVLAWAVENSTGARGFGFTGGHYHFNWGDHGMRTLVLNAIVWASGVEVPDTGVMSRQLPIPRYETIDESIARGDLVDVRRHLGVDMNRVHAGRHPKLSPLQQAILRNKPEVTALLLEAGADPNQVDDSQRTPLHLAVERGSTAVAAELFNYDIDPNTWDQGGWTPLHNAAAKNNLEMAKILLDGGADPQVRSKLGGTPLHEAAASGSAELVRLFLSAGIDPQTVSKEGVTALDLARQYGNEEAEAVLLEVARN